MPEDKLRRVNIQNSIDLIEMKDIDDHFITRVCLTYLRSHLDDDAARRADPENGGETYVELHAENRDAATVDVGIGKCCARQANACELSGASGLSDYR
jgi:hypothetical protein